MYILLFLYLCLVHCICLFIKYGNIPIIYIPFIGFAILKTTLDYRICSVAYAECKIRKVKREKSYVNRFLDPVVDVRYSNHVYPLFTIGYGIIYLSLIKYLREYLNK